MFDEIYKHKVALITGHTGFKGSWLTIWFKELGTNAVGYSLAPPSQHKSFEATKLRKKISHINGDVRDLGRLIKTFEKHQPEFIFRLAAQPIVRLSYEEPNPTFDTNVSCTLNIFEAVSKPSSIKVLVKVTSNKWYGNRAGVVGYRKNDPLGGLDTHKSTKACTGFVFSDGLKLF